MPRRRPKRKVSYKRPKIENTNRKVVLWSGQPAPFTIVPSNFVTKSERLEMVQEDEKNQRKSKKKKKRNKKTSTL